MLRTKIKKSRLLVGILCLILLSGSCQRDDICPESTEITPMLRISFFDSEETDNPKPPVNLRIRAVEPDTVIYARANVTEISIPLRTDLDITTYEFILNAPAAPVEGEEEPEDNSNIDVINFIYSREEIYINRACSFKVNYRDLRTSLGEGDQRWISSIIVEEDNIENETDTHIFIYH